MSEPMMSSPAEISAATNEIVQGVLQAIDGDKRLHHEADRLTVAALIGSFLSGCVRGYAPDEGIEELLEKYRARAAAATYAENLKDGFRP